MKSLRDTRRVWKREREIKVFETETSLVSSNCQFQEFEKQPKNALVNCTVWCAAVALETGIVSKYSRRKINPVPNPTSLLVMLPHGTTYWKCKESASWLWQLIQSFNPAWASPLSGLLLRQQKSENYDSCQSRLQWELCFSTDAIQKKNSFSSDYVYSDSTMIVTITVVKQCMEIDVNHCCVEIEGMENVNSPHLWYVLCWFYKPYLVLVLACEDRD
jgi:hypothetical protein